MPISKEPIVFRKATSCIHCPNDPGDAAATARYVP